LTRELGRDGWRPVCLLSAASLRDDMLGTLAALPALFG